MPYTVNGIGTHVVQGVGLVRWDGEEDGDALECIVVFFMPVFPYKAIHTFGWSGDNYRAFPIRWSPALVVRAFARRWLWVPMVAAIVGVVMGPVLGYEAYQNHGMAHAEVMNGVKVLLGSLAGIATVMGLWRFVDSFDARDADLRRVLGPHDRGSSDPATWKDDMRAGLRSAKDLYGTERFLDAAPALLASGKYSEAMWAARLGALTEDRGQAEAMTNRILRDPGVEAALKKVRADPTTWRTEMAKATG